MKYVKGDKIITYELVVDNKYPFLYEIKGKTLYLNVPKKVDEQLFLHQVLTNANGDSIKVTPELAGAIYEDLISNGYVKRGELTEKYYADKASGTVQVAEEVKDCATSIVNILSSIYDKHSIPTEDARGNNVEAKIDPEKLKKKEFLELWERINHKSFYTVHFDKQELIDNSIREIDAKLDVTRITVKTEYGEQTSHMESREQLEQGDGFRKTRTNQETAKNAPLGSVRYDLVGKLVEETGLTRATIAAILKAFLRRNSLCSVRTRRNLFSNPLS